METKLLKPNKESIELACKLLQDGEVGGVPTETVYGLAGDSRNGEAIKKIFKAKGRPADNPLIVHISNLDMLKGVVRYVSDDAKKLGRPSGFKINVREVYASAGAGFVVAINGAIMTMPGLSKKPAAYGIDVDDNGVITGLF